MNSKHLAKGDACPPMSDKIRIYNMRFCPYAQRAMLVALAKQVPHEVVNCNLTSKPEFLLAKNPGGKVPTLELADGKILYESLIVAEYLDEVFEGRALSARDPYQKAKDKMLVEEFNVVTSLFYKAIGFMRTGSDQSELKGVLEKFQQSLAPFEKELGQRGTVFFAGDDAPGMVDYMLWPWIERSPILKMFVTADVFDFEGAKKQYPKLESWRKGMKDDDAVKEYFIEPNVHKQFIQSHLAGSPNYDLLD